MLPRTLALPLLLTALVAAAQEDRRRLVEQKMRLVEMLVDTQAAKSATGGAPQTRERLERGRAALAEARQALAENQLAEATRVLDEALRASSTAPQPATNLSADAQRQAYQNLVEQVATYRASIEELATHPRRGDAARLLLGRLDAIAAEARRQAVAGDLERASRLLGEAYQLAIGELARLRAGEEVVLSLKFASPADEYAYETRRYQSNQMLVRMMLDDGKAEGGKRALVDGFLAESDRLQREAANLADSGRHGDAVRRMETAAGQINRALQVMGVPVF